MFEELWVEWSRNKQKKIYFWTVVPVFEYKNAFCGILEDYSSFCKKKRVVIKVLKFLNCINSSCLGYCILEVVGKIMEE